MFYRLARKRAIGQMKSTLAKSYEEGRLVFSPVAENKVEYTDKAGAKHNLSLDECAALLWDKFNKQLVEGTGTSHANLGVLDIPPDDIKAILLDLRGKSQKEAK